MVAVAVAFRRDDGTLPNDAAWDEAGSQSGSCRVTIRPRSAGWSAIRARFEERIIAGSFSRQLITFGYRCLIEWGR